jgi:hypothetical protein
MSVHRVRSCCAVIHLCFLSLGCLLCILCRWLASTAPSHSVLFEDEAADPLCEGAVDCKIAVLEYGRSYFESTSGRIGCGSRNEGPGVAGKGIGTEFAELVPSSVGACCA